MGWLWAVLDALLPCACAGCGASAPPARVLCPRCEASVPAIAADACPRCQLHRAHAGVCAEIGPLDAAVAAVWLEPPVSDWIHAFKYPPRGLRGLAPGPLAAAAELAARAARRAPGPAPDLVVPVPLHPRRLRARGFNPALTVARTVSRSVRAPLDATALERVRDTPSQTGLDAAARARNVRGALRARRGVPERLWLVDDVVTTGATLRESARALRAAGARSVIAVCAARTPRP
ncbi:MAG TPA: double zinc ribbon domain-containing protein [Myxococcota bacterium]|nr:double zinc ribbon domain-containing protein [Myxococcota bacterium]